MTDNNSTSLDFGTTIAHGLRSGFVSLVNLQRNNMPQKIDYVQFTLPNTLSPIPEQRNIIQQQIMGKPPMSLIELELAFDRIANDSRPKGVILYLRGFAMPFADLQTLRDSILRLRNRGKRVVAFAQDFQLADYYIASACDEIIIQPSSMLMTTGVVMQRLYLKEGLKAVGLSVDAIQITPYKSSPDQFTRTESSEESEAQTNWLLDSIYTTLTEHIAKGRDLTPHDVREMIDQSPMTDKDALEAGYVDAISNEEGLRAHLDAEHILLWEHADNFIPLKMPRSPEQYVGVIYTEGAIVPGESASPPVDVPLPLVGGPRIGDITVTRQVRNLMQDDNCVAVVLYVNSPGGSASASEAMASALDELAKKKPLVVYMGAVAASGGYYISTSADYVVAQPSTITGSIGVFNLKFVNSELLDKLRFNQETFGRGNNSDIYLPDKHFTEAQREKMQQSIERIYEQFLERVANARKMKVETVDGVAGGRVWMGEQALEHGLVDELGGLYEAVAKARELANAPLDIPFGIMRSKGKPLPAQIAEQADPAASFNYYRQSIDMINGQMMMMLPTNYSFK